MNKKELTYVIVIAALVFGAAGWGIYEFLYFRDQYAEAESLVEPTRGVAEAYQRYLMTHGHRPADYSDLTEFDSALDIAPLEGYEYEFYPDGLIAYRLVVNESYAFAVGAEGKWRWDNP